MQDGRLAPILFAFCLATYLHRIERLVPVMKPWEKRLRDLSQLLLNCHATYMDPDLFRASTNQFLQTARTVTFIIQKNKDTIPGFAIWYVNEVQTPWSADEIMLWAKNARNTIEKEGDLELNSSLLVTLLFSYLKEQDTALHCGRSELLHANVKKLIRFAQKKLPSGISDAAVIKIERKWIAASLPIHELLRALTYVYAKTFECCASLAQKLGGEVDNGVPRVDAFAAIGDDVRQIHYIKLNGLGTSKMATKTVSLEKADEQITTDMRADLDRVIAATPSQTSFDAAFTYYKMMAETTFARFGNHTQMLFLLDSNWRPLKMINTAFADQADKFVFWRYVADLIERYRVSGVVWIGEAWRRTLTDRYVTPVRNMPIVGERLNVQAIDDSGVLKEASWEIIRTDESARPTLSAISATGNNEKFPNYLIPVTRALGLPDPIDLKNSQWSTIGNH